MTDPLCLTRALVDRLPPRTDERGPVKLHQPEPGYHERMAEAILAQSDGSGPLWIFAAGSLIWNPRFEVAERRAAHVRGWQRSFCISDQRFRGSPSAPGLMMSLDRGGACTGMVLRMAPDDLSAALVALLETEPPLPPVWVEAETVDGPVRAIVFAIERSWPLYVPEPEPEALADILASAVGHVGTMAEYLLNTVTELDRAGVHDAHLWHLQALVAARLAQLPPSDGG
ncbi:gamma-glutamylcyclotransferase [Pseudodonghicola flavimaris]|uniref:glutathione-specific gamma-glutamylcyclotransferase n=1 Tax=Pseudodonghicola flavimaris TaxID=3050036 RepID=A0ABT7EVV1_9RHOB|nr:gamma-glutamylcyclotransferase [Pseudodonghicola flavimaris]MDK3016477.1 gamma-glutamylcyclotransferase [Pseudodonghicola flavimaris]